MRRSTITAVGLTGTLAVAGLLLGCAGSDDDRAAGTVSSSSVVDTVVTETDPPATDPPAAGATDDTEPVATEPVTTEPVATESAATEQAATAPPAADASDCLIGDWVVTEEQMDAYYAGLMSTMEAPLGLDTVGSAPLSFAADGTYTWAPDFALVVDVAGQSGTGDVAGTITGEWAAADGLVTTSSDVEALTVSITVNGVTFEGADLANGLLNASPVNGVTYSCDGPTPVLDFLTTDPEVTVPVTLAPA